MGKPSVIEPDQSDNSSIFLLLDWICARYNLAVIPLMSMIAISSIVTAFSLIIYAGHYAIEEPQQTIYVEESSPVVVKEEPRPTVVTEKPKPIIAKKETLQITVKEEPKPNVSIEERQPTIEYFQPIYTIEEPRPIVANPQNGRRDNLRLNDSQGRSTVSARYIERIDDEIAPKRVDAGNDVVYFTVKYGVKYHRSTCRYLKNRECASMPRKEAKLFGYEPCSVCSP